jgi:hypothetical protein
MTTDEEYRTHHEVFNFKMKLHEFHTWITNKAETLIYKPELNNDFSDHDF